MKHAAVALALVVLAAAGVVTEVATTNAADKHTHASQATSRVTVIAKEFSFTLSKRSVPVGTVIFTVVNRGKITHNFKIAGKTTKKLNPGQRTTVTVKFTKNGRYAYRVHHPRTRALGMKGVLTVGLKAVIRSSRVTVNAKEFSFSLSKRSVPVGTRDLHRRQQRQDHPQLQDRGQDHEEPQPRAEGDARGEVHGDRPLRLSVHPPRTREARHEGRALGRPEGSHAAADHDDDSHDDAPTHHDNRSNRKRQHDRSGRDVRVSLRPLPVDACRRVRSRS